jgi:transcriptional regulator with XRE-family HTH domain
VQPRHVGTAKDWERREYPDAVAMVARDGPGVFAGLLRKFRRAAGLSQDELAERGDLSRRGISDLERRQRRSPHPSTARRLADALGLDSNDRAELLAHAHSALTVVVDHMTIQEPLPHPVTRFVGRDRELAEIRVLLETSRLLTLTGVGGMGKTRLALDAARPR